MLILRLCIVRILLSAWLLIGSGNQAAALESCDIAGESAINTALSYGFGFSVKQRNGNQGSCSFIGPSLVASAGQQGEVVCVSTYFESRRLAEDWSITNVEFSAQQHSFETQPNYTTADPMFMVALKAPLGKTVVLTLRSIEFSGPSCDNWEDAFEGSVAKDGQEEEHTRDDVDDRREEEQHRQDE